MGRGRGSLNSEGQTSIRSANSREESASILYGHLGPRQTQGALPRQDYPRLGRLQAAALQVLDRQRQGESIGRAWNDNELVIIPNVIEHGSVSTRVMHTLLGYGLVEKETVTWRISELGTEVLANSKWAKTDLLN